MPDFIADLAQALSGRSHELLRTLGAPGARDDQALGDLVRAHWTPLPDRAPLQPACAVDGSLGQLDLDNGSTFIVAQALALGTDGLERSSIAFELLPPTVGRTTAARLADLLQRGQELSLAAEVLREGALPPGSTLFLDGALHGLLPQLYPLRLDADVALPDHPQRVLDAYLGIMSAAQAAGVGIVAVAKTSREATHVKVWRESAGLDGRLDIPASWSDAALIGRWAGDQSGVSHPVVLGRRGFIGGSLEILQRAEVAGSPAIVSCFVRLAAMDDLLRVDLPAHQAGDPRSIGDLDAELLSGGAAAMTPILGQLATDWGGPEVYNALLYAVDRAVRLRRQTLAEVYLPLLAEALGLPLRPDRANRRFL